MLVAVTGATGFLGRYIVNQLLREGHSCRCWHRAESDRGGFVEAGERLTWLEGRLNDPLSTEALVRGVDAVVHAALSWARTEGNLPDFAQSNIIGSLRLMDAAKQVGAQRFVFISTCAVHDHILDDRPLDETHPLWPFSHYGAHKAAIEKFVHSFGLARQDWGICALRPTGIYGLRRPVQRSKWYELVRSVARGQAVSSVAGGKEVHAADVAQAVKILLDAPIQTVAGQAYNCYDLYVADQDVARIAQRITGSGSAIQTLNPGPKHQIDTSKIQAMGMRFGGRGQLVRYVADLCQAVTNGVSPTH